MTTIFRNLVSAPRFFTFSAFLIAVTPLALHANDRINNISLGDVPQILNNIVRGATRTAPITVVRSVPGYVVAPGDGYAGRGYYYGPPNTSYYERRDGVRYYSDYENVPSGYRTSGQESPRIDQRETVSIGASVQQALARNGYYNGTVDGVIGRKSHRSIAAYQQDKGLAITGDINSALLASLGL